MNLRCFTFWMAVGTMVLGAAPAAHAHGMAGKRFFPATLVIDDPFVADEMTAPGLLVSPALVRLMPEEDAGVLP